MTRFSELFRRLRGPVMATRTEAVEAFGPNPVLARLVTLSPLWTVLLVLLLGPGVMWTTHAVYLRLGLLAGVERTLPYFLSATWGDALLLPLIALLSMLALEDIAEYGSQARLAGGWAWVPFVWAVASTAALSASWLSDAANVNWTQPVGKSVFGWPLSFNSAGWLHAAFFVAMQWLIAEFVVRLIITLWVASRDVGFDSRMAGALGRMIFKTNAILVCALVFSGLLIRDYWPQITTIEATRTWSWFIVPAVVLLTSVAVNWVLLAIVAREVRGGHIESMRHARRSLGSIIELWSIVFTPAALLGIALSAPRVVSAVGLLAGSCVALAVLAALNVWAEVYQIQCRTMKGWVPLWAMAAVFGVTLAGFVLSLDMIVSAGSLTRLIDVVGPWLAAIAFAFVASAIAVAFGLALAGYESLSRTSLERARTHPSRTFLGAESPQHDIIQNVMQFGALQGLLPLYAAAYVILAEPLMLGKFDSGTQVSLLFGYAGVVAAAVTFPLYNNMQYIRDLETRKNALVAQGGGSGCEDALHLQADMTFTMALSIAVGVIAVLSAMWMWITVLDLVLAAA